MSSSLEFVQETTGKMETPHEDFTSSVAYGVQTKIYNEYRAPENYYEVKDHNPPV